MLTSSIGWILVGSGVITAGGGLVALLVPKRSLRLGFGVSNAGAAATFFVRYVGILVFLIGAMTWYSANVPGVRTPILVSAAVEKFFIVALIFFGPVKRTPVMTAIATGDGLFAILYSLSLA